jgi:hypothetical protein
LQTGQGSTLETLRAIQQFFVRHAVRLGDVVKSGSLRQLDRAVADLAKHVTAQAGTTAGVKGATEQAKALRAELTEKHMLPIARIAAVDLPRTPALSKLRMPKGNLTVEKLAGAANGMAQQAAPYAQTFIDAGLPPDFLDQLQAAANAAASFGAQRKGSAGAGKAATKGIKDSISAGVRVISAVDGLVRKALDAGVPSDVIIRTEWDSVKKVRKTATRSTTAPEPLPIPPEPAAQTQPSTGAQA